MRAPCGRGDAGPKSGNETREGARGPTARVVSEDEGEKSAKTRNAP